MKHISKGILALFLAILMATMVPAQVYADTPEYISEIRIGVGDDMDEAIASLDGYKVFKTDINEGAEPDIENISVSDKAVVIGYKTTRSREDAITDLALMNMEGDYTLQNYEVAFESKMMGEVVPFVNSFIASLEEYRENYESDNPENQRRAQYFHDALNHLIDDDTGMGMGDYLLNETKYEMGDDAYEALSDAEKKQHGDILNLLLQCNGKALLLIRTMIAWSTDTNDDTWLDRFSGLTYNDLVKQTGKKPSEAQRILARQYEDDAKIILSLWQSFQEQLENYDENEAYLEEKAEKEDELEELYNTVKNFDPEHVDEAATDELAEAAVSLRSESELIGAAAGFVLAADCLDMVPYSVPDETSTMYDFFMQDYEVVKNDLTMLYPLVASLTAGQRASLEFFSLSDLVRMTQLRDEGYEEVAIEDMEDTSVYLGVDRSIYGMSSVAATARALKNNVGTEMRDPLSNEIWDCLFAAYNQRMAELVSFAMDMIKLGTNVWKFISAGMDFASYGLKCFSMVHMSTISNFVTSELQAHLAVQLEYLGTVNETIQSAKELSLLSDCWATFGLWDKLLMGVSYAVAIYNIISIYLTIEEIMSYYDVEFSPAPRYIVDAVDMMTFNENGEETLIKNVPVYYTAVKCNRSEDSDKYEAMNDIADICGDIGRQWLALYYTKNKALPPILADTFLVKTGASGKTLPAGYEKGLHLFGTNAALDVNSTIYNWSHGLNGLYVYYKTDKNASTVGSVFSNGYIAIAAVGGIAFGAVVTAFAMTTKKRKENAVQTVN